MILVAIRVRDFPDPVEGSITVKCTRCEGDCWVAPSTERLRLHDRPDVEVVCQHCIGIVVGERVALVRDALVRNLSEGV